MAETQTGFLTVPEGQLYWVHDNAKTASTESRPTLLFIHAGVADHTLWDDQVSHFTGKGWSTLRYDILGYGKSIPRQEYLSSDPRPKIRHYEHAAQLVEEVLGKQIQGKVIVTGLSRGGAAAVDFAVGYPELVAGLVIAAGGIEGFDYPEPDPREEAVFSKEAALLEDKDVEGLARLNVRIWGDGPLQDPGRAFDEVREKLYKWCIDIARRECDKTGGNALEEESLNPPAGRRLGELKVPVAVALGLLDESATILCMRFVANQVKQSDFKEFNTAHMINLETPEEYNRWFENWLDKNL